MAFGKLQQVPAVVMRRLGYIAIMMVLTYLVVINPFRCVVERNQSLLPCDDIR